MSNHKDEPSTTEAPADTADIEQELSDEEMGAVAGGVSATLSENSVSACCYRPCKKSATVACESRERSALIAREG